MTAHPLVHLNAALNTTATVLLIVALVRIKQGNETAHGKTMIAAFVTSAVFLVSYLTYHALVGHVDFTHTGWRKLIYSVVLWTHIPLAFTVPFLAIAAMLFGARALGWGASAALPIDDRARFRAKHLRLVRWAYPIWIYVSITGVIVYLMLYHLWPPEAPPATIGL